MTGRSHLTIGTSTAVAVVTLATMTAATAAVVVATTAAVSKLPDWDFKVGLRYRRPLTRVLIMCALAALVFAITLVAAWYVAAGVGVVLAVVLSLKHRGGSHTLVALALVATAVAFVLSLDARTATYSTAGGIGVLIGYGMHLIADACTPHGIPAFAPLYRRDVHVLPEPLWIGSDSRAEHMIVYLSIVGAILLGVTAYG